MKKLFAALVISLVAVIAQAAWVEGTVVGVVATSPTQQNPPIFINTYTGAGTATWPRGVWSTVDVSAIVPVGTKAIRLDGILIITHGTTPEICDLTIALKTNASDLYDYAYIGQTIESDPTGGQRSNMGTWVALDANRRFMIKWNASPGAGTWPTYCAYGINLSAQSYVR